MSSRACAFISIVLALGTAAAVHGAFHWTSSGIGTFAIFFVLCVGTSLFRVVLPRVQGNLSLSYVFLIWGIARLGLGETILMGCTSALLQSYWHCQRKPHPVQVLFNLSLISLSVWAGKVVFTGSVVQWLIHSEMIRILLASTAYFLVNTGFVATIIALTESRSAWSVWRGSYLWTLPHYVLGASIVVTIEALQRAFGLEIVLLVVPAAYLVYRTFQIHIEGLNRAMERVEAERRHAEETANLHLRTIRALALAIEAKDHTTGEHLHRVQTYAIELGKDFHLSPDDMEALRAAAILHDVGKIAVPEHIISKPAKLTPEEFGKMKIHPVVGAEIVESVQFPFPVAPLVRAHHEKWDGTGYPDGLKGEEIPLGARILTAVDCLDALASDRQYRKAMPLDKAMGIVRAESGKSFDPRVVEALDKRYRELEQLARQTAAGVNVVLSTELKVGRGLAPDAGYATGWDGTGRVSDVLRDNAASEIPVIRGIQAEISRRASIEQTLSAVSASLQGLIPFDCLALYKKTDEILHCVHARGSSEELLSNLTIPLGTGVSGWVAANGRPLLNGSALTEFGFSGAAPPGFDLQAGLAVALDSEFGASAVLTLYSRERDAFTTGHLRVLLAIASWLGYYLWLDSKGLTEAQPAAPAPHPQVGIQLERLSEHVHSEALSPVPSFVPPTASRTVP
ncbi:MAG: HD domain-containing protein [Bryobacterales bacterium]|nr:HD domain-containing protein [Bryobacterales bacterium]